MRARRPDQPALPPSPASTAERLEPGRAAFSQGAFFDAHDLWEEVWRDLAVGAERTVVQGLIQIAAGCHHLHNRRPGPAARLLEKGLVKLSAGIPTAVLGSELHLPALSHGVARMLSELGAVQVSTAGPANLPDPTTLKI